MRQAHHETAETLKDAAKVALGVHRAAVDACSRWHSRLARNTRLLLEHCQACVAAQTRRPDRFTGRPSRAQGTGSPYATRFAERRAAQRLGGIRACDTSRPQRVLARTTHVD